MVRWSISQQSLAFLINLGTVWSARGGEKDGSSLALSNQGWSRMTSAGSLRAGSYASRELMTNLPERETCSGTG